jgi:hypothetical protein
LSEYPFVDRPTLFGLNNGVLFSVPVFVTSATVSDWCYPKMTMATSGFAKLCRGETEIW